MSDAVWQITQQPPVSPRHQRIMASAGSGKTYQLSSRYLEFFARGAAPESMLATTFTRQAAGEIRDRVLRRLAEAAENEDMRTKLAKAIGVASLSSQEARAGLSALTRRIHLLRIDTIDAFFAGVVRTHALELGIEPGSDIIDEHQERVVRREAMRLMLNEADAEKLINLLRALTQGETDRGIFRRIDSLVSDMLEVYREAPQHAWERSVDAAPVTFGEMNDAIDVLLEAGHDIRDDRLIEAHEKDYARAVRRDWLKFLSTGIAKAIAEGKSTYWSKPIPQRTVEAYEAVIAIARRDICWRIRQQTLAMRDLLERFDRELQKVQRRHRALTFSDLTHAMRRAREIGSIDEICLRLDGQLHHLLLDEFQDTSVAQWRAIQPIASLFVEDESADRSLFCVGDVKQSIYGWRGGCPEILGTLPELLLGAEAADHINTDTLSASYRSAPEVIDFVNQVFSDLAANAAMSSHVDTARSWATAFEAHSTTRSTLPGYVQVAVTPVADGGSDADSQRDVRHAETAKRVAELHARNPQLTIGVLVPQNDQVMKLMYALGRAGVSAGGLGGRPLTDNAPVNLLLDVLTLADHPEHSAAAYHIACSPLAHELDMTDWRSASARRRASRHIRRMLLEDGYGATIGRWAMKLHAGCTAWERIRLAQFADLAAMHDRRASLRPDDFLARVDETRFPVPGGATVSVMTIHQSKGLEFDMVFLPELEDNLTGHSGRTAAVVERDGPAGDIKGICRYLNSTERALLPAVGPMIEAHIGSVVRESLCKLYVAITRARLAVFVMFNAKNTPGKTLAGVIHDAICEGGDAPEPGQTMFEAGDLESVLGHGRQGSSAGADVADGESIDREAPIRLSRESDASIRSAAASPSSAATDERVPVMLPDGEARARGRALHAMFERIEWLDDGAPSRDELLIAVREAAPRQSMDPAWRQSRLDEFEAAIARPDVQRLLRRGDRERASVAVYREIPFARMKAGAVQQGYIDRLEVERDASGAVVSATVIDFKTDELEGAVTSDAARARAQRYIPQLAAYSRAAAAFLNLEIETVRAAVVLTSAGVVVDLGVCTGG